MADCKSPIVSARCQPLRHNVAIRSVFNKALVTSINTFYWGEDLEAPRSMEASSSSLLQLPSCGEGIQTRKNSPNTNWQVIDATATSKEVAGTDNGASSWLNISIFDGAMASSSSFLIASEQNKLSITTLFVFYSTSTKAQHCTWTQNHELTAHVVDCRCGLSALHVSFIFWKMFPQQDERNSVWGLHLLQICLTTFKLRYTTSYPNSNPDQACTKKRSTNTCRECDILRHWVDWERIADELKATLVVLQGQQPRHSNSTSSSLVLLACATGIYLPKGTAKEQGHGRKHTKSFV